MIIRYLKKIYYIVFSCILLSLIAVLNVFAWGTSTHGDLLKKACDVLRSDGKGEVVSFYEYGYKNLIYGAQSPDWEESIPGTHYYVCKDAPSENGRYYKNANGNYSRSARTRFEEHYSTAINQYKNGNTIGAFESLGKAIHYLCDIGCPAHSGGIRYPIIGENKHANFETFGDKHCKKYMIDSANGLYNHVLSSDFATILNELGEATSAYKFAVNEASETSFGIALEKTIPLSQQYTAAILNRFFIEANSASTQYIKDNEVYLINILGTDMYLDTYYTKLKVYEDVKNKYQKFILRLNQDGSYHISPVYDTSKALSVGYNSVVLENYSASDEAQKFKIIYYPDCSTRIVSAKSQYDYILGKSWTKAITIQDFSPENTTQRFRFTSIRS